jgi:hypothetical protein
LPWFDHRGYSDDIADILRTVVISMTAFKMYSAQLHSLSPFGNWGNTVPEEDFRTECLKFEPKFANAKVELIEHLVQGSSAALPYRDQTCGGPGSSAKLVQDVCRVALRIDTSERSGIHFEAWFPKDYSGRILATGNGGLNGCMFLVVPDKFMS